VPIGDIVIKPDRHSSATIVRGSVWSLGNLLRNQPLTKRSQSVPELDRAAGLRLLCCQTDALSATTWRFRQRCVDLAIVAFSFVRGRVVDCRDLDRHRMLGI